MKKILIFSLLALLLIGSVNAFDDCRYNGGNGYLNCYPYQTAVNGNPSQTSKNTLLIPSSYMALVCVKEASTNSGIFSITDRNALQDGTISMSLPKGTYLWENRFPYDNPYVENTLFISSDMYGCWLQDFNWIYYFSSWDDYPYKQVGYSKFYRLSNTEDESLLY